MMQATSGRSACLTGDDESLDEFPISVVGKSSRQEAKHTNAGGLLHFQGASFSDAGGCDTTGFVSVISLANKSLGTAVKTNPLKVSIILATLSLTTLAGLGFFDVSLDPKLAMRVLLGSMLLAWVIGSSMMVHYLCTKYTRRKRGPTDDHM
eukprot:TRINITY_DN65357_c0_g1_i1.p1 TRINITY_DN65357_c0_g1~~TRINITY_DN65357_c0_g1_i1.p1  ORF type:complete len:151 (+),score=17.18 TRINITY_DN65357_c0_g1_i1:65-517(+)